MKISDKFDLSKLNEKELLYFKLIYPKSGTPFFYSEPGIAKTSMMKQIAKKLNLYYIDMRLSTRDETDLGLYPSKKEYEVVVDGKKTKMEFLDHIVPKWAYLANNPPGDYAGTLLHLEELNRSQLAVRNAALQILLERSIGEEFKFNDDVYMVSSGNIGDEDGSDVEEFDSALNGRLIHYRHTLNLNEWIEYYANDNVHQSIIKYLLSHPEHFYISKRNSKDRAYASPRSWTFLSDFIRNTHGDNAPVSAWLKDIQKVGHAYVGAANTSFVRYLADSLKIGIDDIIDRYPEMKKSGVKFNRDKKSELLSDLKSMDISNLPEDKIENVKVFVTDLEDDEIVSYIIKLIDDKYDDKYLGIDTKKDAELNKFIFSFLKDARFKRLKDKITEHTSGKKK